MKRILAYLNKKLSDLRTYPKQTEAPVSYAFTFDGVDYYQFESIEKMPFKRALAALPVYQEMQSGVTKEYLEQHTKFIDALMKDKFTTESVFKVAQANQFMKERLKWIAVEDIAYKLAAIVFFSKDENPNEFDWNVARKKVESWKKSPNHAFFLNQQISRYINFGNLPEKDLPLYFQMQEMESKVHLDFLSKTNSAKGTTV